VEAPSILTRHRGDLDAFLRSVLDRAGPPLLHRMMRYHLGWEDEEGRPTSAGGKALRPSLCLWACEAAGGDWRDALPAAAAVELVHSFSLVHDDIQDADRMRHHRPTVWSVWGEPQAINAGDSLFALAQLALLRLGDGGFPPDKIVQAARILDEATLTMIEGQCLDLSFEERAEVALEEYLEMIAKKTGALLGASLHLGAVVGSDDPSLAERFAHCGRLLGTAFQVQDDVLGTWGREQVTGKPAADVRRRKKSLPLVYALAHASGGARDTLLRSYAREALDNGDVSRVVAVLDDLGARDYCQTMTREHIEAALAELTPTGIRPTAQREFTELAEFLLTREF
jgi:geranylgeranyl diphosphate synthase type I